MPTNPHAELDALLASYACWNTFYENRAKPCPFFVPFPDESLAGWVDEGLIPPGRALDLGCGHGRNAIFLARRGFNVEGIDYSQTAIDWARERVNEAAVDVALRCESVFDAELERGSCNLVCDSGCFHHLPPHRRDAYVDLVADALKPQGWFSLTCFRPEGGSGYSDDEVCERGSLGGGLGYTAEQLTATWSRRLQIRTLRQMQKRSVESGLFGEPFLWAMLAQKA